MRAAVTALRHGARRFPAAGSPAGAGLRRARLAAPAAPESRIGRIGIAGQQRCWLSASTPPPADDDRPAAEAEPAPEASTSSASASSASASDAASDAAPSTEAEAAALAALRALPIKQRRKAQRATDPVFQAIAGELFAPEDALQWVRKAAKNKFDETLELIVELNLDVRKSDQMMRCMCLLPNGRGKKLKVAVFAKGEQAAAALAAGADRVGSDDLVQFIKDAKKVNKHFDAVLATPDELPTARQVARLLGPKGLMPNAKVGTVARDIAEAVVQQQTQAVTLRTDKFGIVSLPAGKLSFADGDLLENVRAVMLAIRENKPAGAAKSGKYIKKCYFKSTTGPAVGVATHFMDAGSARFMRRQQPSKPSAPVRPE